MCYVYCGIFFCILCGCSYSVVVTGNQGKGTDSVEESATVDPTISPMISLPKEGV